MKIEKLLRSFYKGFLKVIIKPFIFIEKYEVTFFTLVYIFLISLLFTKYGAISLFSLFVISFELLLGFLLGSSNDEK